MQAKKNITVVVGLFKKDKTFLMALRPITAPGGGMWEFPGGKVEPNETLQDALQREIMEELGVESSVKNLVWNQLIEYDDSICNVHIFNCDILNGDPKPLASDELRWVNVSDIYDYNLIPGVRKALIDLI